jgi:hypothetical protein
MPYVYTVLYADTLHGNNATGDLPITHVMSAVAGQVVDPLRLTMQDAEQGAIFALAERAIPCP